MIKVAIIEDNKKYLDCLLNSINAFPDSKVIHSLHNALHITEHFSKNIPDVALIDINMPGISGLEAAALIQKQFPHCKCIMLTVLEDTDLLLKAYKNGAMGYLIKGKDSIVKVMETIRLVHNLGDKTEFSLNPGMARQMLDNQISNEARLEQNFDKHNLTERQAEVAKLLLTGLSYKEIAQKLTISIDTLNSHVKALYPKLGVNSRAELMKII